MQQRKSAKDKIYVFAMKKAHVLGNVPMAAGAVFACLGLMHSADAAKPGAYRAIKVTAGTDGYSKLQVRTKAGYIK
jgi:hypothetical protein